MFEAINFIAKLHRIKREQQITEIAEIAANGSKYTRQL